MKRFIRVSLSVALVSLIVVVGVHHVPSRLSPLDKEYLPLFLEGVDPVNGSKLEYGDQVRNIREIQEAVQSRVSLGTGIPFGQTREPLDLYAHGRGECFDIGRTLEKALRFNGYKTRHVAVYSIGESNRKFPVLHTLTTPQVPSHAIQEVWTKQGWLVVDSNIPWIALDTLNAPYSMKAVSRRGSDPPIPWLYPYPEPYAKFYDGKPIVVIYGLLSRHGMFYPPFNRIPDYNLRDLLYNF